MKRIYFLFLVTLGIITILFSSTPSFAQPQAAQITPVSPDERSAVEQAIYQAVNSQKGDRLVTLIYQTRVMDLVFSPDGLWGRAWLVETDPKTGDTAPIEPGLAVVHKENGAWTVFLQADSSWLNAIQTSPESLFTSDEKSIWSEMYRQVQANLPTAPLTGYRLPWKAGETRSLSQSVLHDKYDASLKAHYAFDFYVHDTMWDIYAAKSGTVFLFKDDVPTCNINHCDGQGSGNYIIIKDITTNPTSYMLYLHLAQNSIPSELKQVGAVVTRAQIIGLADNTGASYGDHLHFMVHTNPSSWWGQSVDITFVDVSINGGRPRVKNQFVDDEPYCLHKNGFNDVCDNFQTDYVSHNAPCEIPDNTPPDGALINPSSDGSSITNTLSLEGWGEDTQCGLAVGQFIAEYNGAWQNIGPAFPTSPFNYDWNMCDIPDGPVEVGLRLTDQAANSIIIGARSLSKDYTCPAPPQPSCIPGANEVMLFDGVDYTGTCMAFSPGDYATLGNLTNQTSAILVGANVQATLFINSDYTGRGETFFANDNNLADNRIGSDTAASMLVNWRTQPPLMPSLQSPIKDSEIPLNDIVTFFWDNRGSATDYQLHLSSNVTVALTSSWQTETYLHLEDLPVGIYAWQVRGRNPGANVGSWSAAYTFTITNTGVTTPTMPAPYTDTMETHPEYWSATGFWHLVNDSTLSHSRTHSWWYQNDAGTYDDGMANTGDLTSPAFIISTGGHYYLRFFYRYTTETQGKDWDQRWVQISIDGGPFSQSRTTPQRQQLTDDPFADELSDPKYLSSQVIDLGLLDPGQFVRIRFHFDTLDAFKNDLQGWAIDDVSVSTTPPDGTDDSNNTPQQATLITPGNYVDDIIRPKGDFDYYKFNAAQGDRIVADVDAQSIGSQLDPYLFLLDSDGESILAFNDDEVYAQNRDSFIAFLAPHTGTYYLKLRAWNNPDVGGSQYFYKLYFYLDNNDPVLNFTNPANSAGFINGQVVSLTATSSDAQSGIAQVDFYFHDNDWINQNWILLGSDTNGADGWSIPINQPDQAGIALYVKSIDRSRNVAGQGYWNLAIDRSAPQTALLPLTSTQTSTAFLLEWTGSDNLSGIDSYQLQWSMDNGSIWTDYPLTFTADTHSTWIVGAPGQHYAFRMRGIDRARNVEPFPTTVETSTTIPGIICTSFDQWEVDNTAITATEIFTNQAQIHNFCNPEATDGLYDTDWITFTAHAGQHYLIQVTPTAPSAAASISIFIKDGITLTLRAEGTQNNWGKPTSIDWIAAKTEVLYIRIQHVDGRVAGSSVTYKLYISKNIPVFLPILSQH